MAHLEVSVVDPLLVAVLHCRRDLDGRGKVMIVTLQTRPRWKQRLWFTYAKHSVGTSTAIWVSKDNCLMLHTFQFGKTQG